MNITEFLSGAFPVAFRDKVGSGPWRTYPAACGGV